MEKKRSGLTPNRVEPQSDERNLDQPIGPLNCGTVESRLAKTSNETELEREIDSGWGSIRTRASRTAGKFTHLPPGLSHLP